MLRCFYWLNYLKKLDCFCFLANIWFAYTNILRTRRKQVIPEISVYVNEIKILAKKGKRKNCLILSNHYLKSFRSWWRTGEVKIWTLHIVPKWSANVFSPGGILGKYSLLSVDQAFHMFFNVLRYHSSQDYRDYCCRYGRQDRFSTSHIRARCYQIPLWYSDETSRSSVTCHWTAFSCW